MPFLKSSNKNFPILKPAYPNAQNTITYVIISCSILLFHCKVKIFPKEHKYQLLGIVLKNIVSYVKINLLQFVFS